MKTSELGETQLGRDQRILEVELGQRLDAAQADAAGEDAEAADRDVLGLLRGELDEVGGGVEKGEGVLQLGHRVPAAGGVERVVTVVALEVGDQAGDAQGLVFAQDGAGGGVGRRVRP